MFLSISLGTTEEMLSPLTSFNPYFRTMFIEHCCDSKQVVLRSQLKKKKKNEKFSVKVEGWGKKQRAFFHIDFKD
jgi:hypothetical protein